MTEKQIPWVCELHSLCQATPEPVANVTSPKSDEGKRGVLCGKAL